jgi:hypothetical protein
MAITKMPIWGRVWLGRVNPRSVARPGMTIWIMDSGLAPSLNPSPDIRADEVSGADT